MALCKRLQLTHINISTFLLTRDYNDYGDEDLSVVARLLPHLKELDVETSKVRRKGAAVVVRNLPMLDLLTLWDNPNVGHNCWVLGRLPRVKKLFRDVV